MVELYLFEKYVDRSIALVQRKRPRRQFSRVNQVGYPGDSCEGLSGSATDAHVDPGDAVNIRAYQPGDEAAILRCFNGVFPVARRSLAEWNWEYRDCPGGLRCFVGVLQDGRVVSQFTGIPRRVRVGALERSFSEIVDSFVDPAFRAGLKRPGLFARTAYRYIDHHCRPDCEAFAYGLPTPDAYRLGHRLLGYVHLWNLEILLRDVAEAPRHVTIGAEGHLDALTSFPEDTDELWDRVRKLHDVAVVRDHAYLTWRYVTRPGVAYRRYSLRDGCGDLVGLVVLRDEWLPGDFGARVTAVADWLVDRTHPLARNLFEIIARLGAYAGAEKVGLMFTPGSPDWLLALEAGYRPKPTKFRFVGRTYDPENLPLERAQSSWFVTLGDFDVI